MTETLAILGAGNMAEAIARAILRAGVMRADQIVAADVSPQRRELFQRELKINSLESAGEAVAGADVVLIAVKPQQVGEVLRDIVPALHADALLISIAAGISIDYIELTVGQKHCRVIRAMPNTPMLVGCGAVALARSPSAAEKDVETARRLFEPAAIVIELSEDKLDAVTALSGSGPAYFFYLVEQMIAAGEEIGLTRDEASTLAIRTAVGAGRMLERSDVSVEQLRQRVTSPGGTTEAALTFMQRHQLDRIIIDAIKAAERRGHELGQTAQQNSKRSS